MNDYKLFTDEKEWLNERKKSVGGSEIATLFGLNKYMSRWQLWHLKAGLIEPEDLSNNDAVNRGKFLEPSIAAWVAHNEDWELLENLGHAFYENPNVRGFSATIDYLAKDEKGVFLIEIKTTNWRTWKDYEEKPSMQWILQLQAQMACSGYDRGCIVVMVDSQKPLVFWFAKHEATIAKLEREIDIFWQSIEDNEPPAKDYSDKGIPETIKQLCSPEEKAVVDWSQDNRANSLLEEWLKAAAENKESGERKKALEAEIHEKMGDASMVIGLADWKISRTQTKGSPGKRITADMVGNVIGKKAGYTKLNIKKLETA